MRQSPFSGLGRGTFVGEDVHDGDDVLAGVGKGILGDVVEGGLGEVSLDVVAV